MDFKKVESEDLAKTVVTFHKHERSTFIKTCCKLFQKTKCSSQNNLLYCCKVS